MVNERNIAQEYHYDHTQCLPPYILDFGHDNKPIIDEFARFGIQIHPGEALVQRRVFPHPRGHTDLMITSLKRGYLIKNSISPTGARVLPDRLVVCLDSHQDTRLNLGLFRALRSGSLVCSETDRGCYGIVLMDPGFDKTVVTDRCIKIFNYAHRLDSNAWESAQNRKFKLVD